MKIILYFATRDRGPMPSAHSPEFRTVASFFKRESIAHTMKLLGSTTSPFVRKVRIVLLEKKMECMLEEVDPASDSGTLSTINPLGKIPALVLDDGTCIYDSRVIVEYLDARAPLHRLIPDGNRERAEVNTWQALADGLLDAAILVRRERMRPEGEQSADWIARQAAKVDSALAVMAKQLGDRPWCHGKSFSLADVAVGAALGWFEFRFPDHDWRKTHPGLAAYFDKLSQRPSFSQTAPK